MTNFNPGRVSGADVGWMETIVADIEAMVWADEDATECASCGVEIPAGEARRSWTLDADLCVGCAQDGDNP